MWQSKTSYDSLSYMKHIKSFEIKSVIIGFLLCAVVFLGVAATGTKAAWNHKQRWDVMFVKWDDTEAKEHEGWEVFDVEHHTEVIDGKRGFNVWMRRRVQ